MTRQILNWKKALDSLHTLIRHVAAAAAAVAVAAVAAVAAADT